MTEEEFLAIWQAAELKPQIYIYRLYHDEHGSPLFYSMEDLPGKYIEVDVATFSASPSNVRVVNGKITYLKGNTILKLKPGSVGTPCHPQNVSIVVEDTQPHIKCILK